MPANSRPAAMRAVLLTGHGGLDKPVYRTDVPVPTPARGEVLIGLSISCDRPYGIGSKLRRLAPSVDIRTASHLQIAAARSR
jgi:hypothetical protein